MGDLQINGTVMGDLRRTFSTIAHRMENVSRTMGNANGEGVGAPKLIDDVHDFADEWKYGVKQIGEHADTAVQMIDQIGKTFDDADLQLANSLKPEGKCS
ncbi:MULTISPECIES: hypothetical protein [Streptomyces]|uniref:Uncharacterized protein n=1 Tax=Streptomyces fildesensis TaxID=375757 RepID=A0ABW8CE65_9ACTN|nr:MULTISPECIES: hypothetical protein [unclassified Streptomyces]MCM2419980.1 hypothetical protein [Streptomyces sp. RKAG293]MCM2427830.1 hypothetical protein [Streptomyces sp. RKAG337]